MLAGGKVCWKQKHRLNKSWFRKKVRVRIYVRLGSGRKWRSSGGKMGHERGTTEAVLVGERAVERSEEQHEIGRARAGLLKVAGGRKSGKRPSTD